MSMPYASNLQETLARTNQAARDHKLLSTFLGRVKGAALIPLAYLVHEHKEVTPEIWNAESGSSLQERLMATTTSSGMRFDRDKWTLYDEFKLLVVDVCHLCSAGEIVMNRKGRILGNNESRKELAIIASCSMVGTVHEHFRPHSTHLCCHLHCRPLGPL